jgi:hypothetical protein
VIAFGASLRLSHDAKSTDSRRDCCLVWLAQEVRNSLGDVAGKAEICHRPPGSPAESVTLSVADPALDIHFAHGDTLGPYGDDCEASAFCQDDVCVATCDNESISVDLGVLNSTSYQRA